MGRRNPITLASRFRKAGPQEGRSKRDLLMEVNNREVWCLDDEEGVCQTCGAREDEACRGPR